MNRSRLWILSLAVVSAAATAAPARAATTPREPLAFVAEFSGAVEVTRAASKSVEPVSLGLALRRGDKVQVGEGASATLLLNDGNLLELAEKNVTTIGAARPAGKKSEGQPDEVMAGVFKSVSQGVVGGSRETGLVALAPVRGGAELTLVLAPRQTEVLEDRPSFRWRKVANATRYRVVLSGEIGQLWQHEVAGDTTLDFPTDAPALTRGADYVWELHASGADGELRHEESGFRVKSEAEAASVHKHLERIDGSGVRARDFLAGAYLSGQGLYADASKRFEALVAGHPNEPAPHEALGQVYRAIGLTGEAAAELQKALTLTHKP